MLGFKPIATLVACCLALTPAAATQINQTQSRVVKKIENKQLLCLARNIYFEAGNQSEQGMIAVANVVFNRMEDKRFPNSPCAVIYQRHRGVCQFSWVCSRNQTIRYVGQYQRAVSVAERAIAGQLVDNTGGAKFYHAVYVNPRWGYKRSTRIGDHVFYRG